MTPAPLPVPANAIEIENLTKVYKARNGQPAKTALDGVSLTIPRGGFFALLGPNGAGKSTLINIMAGLVMKTSGTVRVWGTDIDRDDRQARAAIGIVPQELNLDPFFTPRELLEVQAGLYGVPRRERRTLEILDAVGLADKADAYARTLSGGMRRRLLVAKAMVHQPPILVLDEPTAGVDIELRQQLWRYVKELNARGTTILLTTHYLEEAETLCDQTAIINNGTVAACDSTRNLLRRLDSKAVIVTLGGGVPDPLPAGLAAVGACARGGDQIVIRYQPSVTSIGTILEALHTADLDIRDLVTEETDLEDIFLQLTRKAA
ncbi:ABC transporter ATP-binding protein [Roseospira marina]|uniref:ABC transporter ATP-binding protein n=1 Tax=Roseospira marina TaxID=140057 RepID=UPI00185AA90D|nr:ABC transporter ATP-binding protein [Roseospira marina]MBB4314424.1 ABC-2 type transport system ATP-binding protein [Roseospira marina]MBB5087584.1 ABC-2 type transport system ATP-binding protein [Roseospira marina]